MYDYVRLISLYQYHLLLPPAAHIPDLPFFFLLLLTSPHQLQPINPASGFLYRLATCVAMTPCLLNTRCHSLLSSTPASLFPWSLSQTRPLSSHLHSRLPSPPVWCLSSNYFFSSIWMKNKSQFLWEMMLNKEISCRFLQELMWNNFNFFLAKSQSQYILVLFSKLSPFFFFHISS